MHILPLTHTDPLTSCSRALIAETSGQSAVTPRAATPTTRAVWALRAATQPASARRNSEPSCPTWSTTRPMAPSSTPTRLRLPPPPLRPCLRGTWVGSFYEHIKVDMDERMGKVLITIKLNLMTSLTWVWPVCLPQGRDFYKICPRWTTSFRSTVSAGASSHLICVNYFARLCDFLTRFNTTDVSQYWREKSRWRQMGGRFFFDKVVDLLSYVKSKRSEIDLKKTPHSSDLKSKRMFIISRFGHKLQGHERSA